MVFLCIKATVCGTSLLNKKMRFGDFFTSKDMLPRSINPLKRVNVDLKLSFTKIKASSFKFIASLYFLLKLSPVLISTIFGSVDMLTFSSVEETIKFSLETIFPFIIKLPPSGFIVFTSKLWR